MKVQSRILVGNVSLKTSIILLPAEKKKWRYALRFILHEAFASSLLFDNSECFC